jgi:hypothetical protein
VKTKHPTRPDPKTAPGTALLTITDLEVAYGGIKR